MSALQTENRTIRRRYDMNDKSMKDLVTENFPYYANAAQKIGFDGILSLVPCEKDRDVKSFYTEKTGNKLVIKFHDLGKKDGTEKACAVVGLKDNGVHLSVFEGVVGDEYTFRFKRGFRPC